MILLQWPKGFTDALDRDPSDVVTRGVLADWLEEHGDPLAAEGLRWATERGRVPHLIRTAAWWYDFEINGWVWKRGSNTPSARAAAPSVPETCYLPEILDSTYDRECRDWSTATASEALSNLLRAWCAAGDEVRQTLWEWPTEVRA